MKKSILDVLLERASGSLFLDAEGRIIQLKGEASNLLQGGADESIGTPLADHLESAYRNTVVGIMERCLYTGRSEAVALKFMTGREPRQVLFIPRDFSSVNWPPSAVIQVQDLTGSLRTHDISFLSHELFNSILNDIGEGILVMDPELTITHINDFAVNLLELERDRLLGKHASSLPESLSDLLPGAETTRIFSEGLEYHKVAHVRLNSGDELSFLLNFYPVKDAGGIVTHVVETLQDITEEQKTASKIQGINRRLQEKVRVLSVLNKLSVDFNTCTEGDQLYPRLASTIVCGLGFHDTVSVLSLRDTEGGELRLRSFFGAEEADACELISRPAGVAANKLVGIGDNGHGETMRRLGLSTVIYSPVIVDGAVLGYLNIFHRSIDPLISEEETLLRILSENLGHFVKRIRAERQLREKVLTLSVINAISDAFQASRSLEQIAYVFLTGVTAEQGLGFNRAFLFLLDDEGNSLDGYLAVGPADVDEAHRIWDALANERIELSDILNDFSRINGVRETELNRGVRRLTLPCGGGGALCIPFGRFEPVLFKTSDITDDEEREMLRGLGCEEFAAAPLFVAGSPTGILLADNNITHEEIKEGDLQFLQLMTRAAQSHLENLRLNEELQRRLESLKRSNELLQEHRTRLAKLQQLSALGEMAASVAHEIRNPLVSVGGFARSMLEERTPADPDYQYLKIIVDEVNRLEKVVANLLNFAKPMRTNFSMVALRDVIQQAISIVEPEYTDAKVEIITRLDRRSIKAWIDPHLIRQMLLNLMNNALRAMPDGGKLYVSSRAYEDCVRIVVRDTGRGIPKEMHEKIFEPFFTTRSAGTGLGLAIVHRIVKNHGGTIKLKSKEGAGSTFLISLPIMEKTGD